MLLPTDCDGDYYSDVNLVCRRHDVDQTGRYDGGVTGERRAGGLWWADEDAERDGVVVELAV